MIVVLVFCAGRLLLVSATIAAGKENRPFPPPSNSITALVVDIKYIHSIKEQK